MEELIIIMKKWFPLTTKYLSFVPLLLILFRKNKEQFSNEISAVKPYFYLLFIGAIYEIINIRIPSCYHFTVFTVLEFVALWYFFRKIFLKKYNYFLLLSLLIVLLETIIISFFWICDLSDKMDAYLAIPISVFIFTSSFLWFKKLFEKETVYSLWKDPVFYFLSGLIIYFSGGLFISLLLYEITIITGLPETYWLIYLFGAIFMRIMMAVGVWKATEKKPYP